MGKCLHLRGSYLPCKSQSKCYQVRDWVEMVDVSSHLVNASQLDRKNIAVKRIWYHFCLLVFSWAPLILGKHQSVLDYFTRYEPSKIEGSTLIIPSKDGSTWQGLPDAFAAAALKITMETAFSSVDGVQGGQQVARRLTSTKAKKIIGKILNVSFESVKIGPFVVNGELDNSLTPPEIVSFVTSSAKTAQNSSTPVDIAITVRGQLGASYRCFVVDPTTPTPSDFVDLDLDIEGFDFTGAPQNPSVLDFAVNGEEKNYPYIIRDLAIGSKYALMCATLDFQSFFGRQSFHTRLPCPGSFTDSTLVRLQSLNLTSGSCNNLAWMESCSVACQDGYVPEHGLNTLEQFQVVCQGTLKIQDDIPGCRPRVPCDTNACPALASCRNIPPGNSYECICQKGLLGLYCDIDANECVQTVVSPCQKYGNLECVNVFSSYACIGLNYYVHDDQLAISSANNYSEPSSSASSPGSAISSAALFMSPPELLFSDIICQNCDTSLQEGVDTITVLTAQVYPSRFLPLQGPASVTFRWSCRKHIMASNLCTALAMDSNCFAEGIKVDMQSAQVTFSTRDLRLSDSEGLFMFSFTAYDDLGRPMTRGHQRVSVTAGKEHTQSDFYLEGVEIVRRNGFMVFSTESMVFQVTWPDQGFISTDIRWEVFEQGSRELVQFPPQFVLSSDFLVIPPDILSPGVVYIVGVAVSAGVEIGTNESIHLAFRKGSASISLEAQPPPKGGACEVSRECGTASVSLT